MLINAAPDAAAAVLVAVAVVADGGGGGGSLEVVDAHLRSIPAVDDRVRVLEERLQAMEERLNDQLLLVLQRPAATGTEGQGDVFTSCRSFQ
jgi:hypothetical protein